MSDDKPPQGPPQAGEPEKIDRRTLRKKPPHKRRSIVIGVKIKRGEKVALDILAEKEGTTVAGLLYVLIQEYLDRYGYRDPLGDD